MKTVYVLSSTHWDREWYEPFELYRSRLVRMIDRLLEILERDSEYRCFHFDGQTILIEDYLEVRPQNAERLKKLIREGRILIGPWYTMPDEFLISGEALVRNLLRGAEICREYGVSANKNGYVCDIFGHNDQMPQIFRGFGIDAITLFRGRSGYEKDNFVWKGADGTQAIVHKLHPDYAYSQFFFVARWTAPGGEPNSDADIVRKVKEYLEREEPCFATDAVLMIDGVDHMDADGRIPKILAMLNGQIPGYRFVHSNFEDYTAAIRSRMGELERVEGCLYEVGREGVNNSVLKNVLSSQVHLKQFNDRLESRLTLRAEPLDVFFGSVASKCQNYVGKDPYDGYLRLAWDKVLKNQPHDSICGCSISEVHEDNIARYRAAEQLSELVERDLLRAFSEHITVEGPGKDGGIVIFNPCQEAFDGIAEVTLELPAGAHQNQFRIYSPEGEELPFAVVAMDSYYKHVADYGKLIEFPKFDRFTLALPVQLAPFSYTTLTCELLNSARSCEGNEWRFDKFAGFNRNISTMRTAFDTVDNGRLIVRFGADGLLTVTDRRNGRVWKDLLLLEDSGDCGDGWNYIPPRFNRELLSLGAPASFEVLCDTAEYFSARITVRLELPESGDGMARSQSLKPLTVEHDVVLRAGSPRISVTTRTVNTVSHHRLRVLFPTHLKTDRFTTLLPFRMYDWPIEKADWSSAKEADTLVNPNQGAVQLREGEDCFTLYNRGLYEVAVLPRSDTPVCLTLFRSFGNEAGKGPDEGVMGKLLGQEISAEYELDFEPISKSQAVKRANRFKTGLLSVPAACGGKPLPAAHTFAAVTGDAVLSCLRNRKIGDQEFTVVRLYDVDGKSSGRVSFDRPIAAAFACGLNEEDLSALPFEGNGFEYRLGANQIGTYAVRFQEEL